VRAAFDQLIEASPSAQSGRLVREYEPAPQSRVFTSARWRLSTNTARAWLLESKDDADDLRGRNACQAEARAIRQKNTLFWQPRRALPRAGRQGRPRPPPHHARRHRPTENLVEVLSLSSATLSRHLQTGNMPSTSSRTAARSWAAACATSSNDRVQASRPTRSSVAAFDAFTTLCRTAINPTLSSRPSRRCSIQHLLTARLFVRSFSNPEFTRRQRRRRRDREVIDALASGHSTALIPRQTRPLLLAIENAARTSTNFSEKQKFLNTVYREILPGFAVKVADTMGIVYTPPSIVRFMIASIREILRSEFGASWATPACTSRSLHRHGQLPRASHARAAEDRPAAQICRRTLANEIMLLPYYIAASTWSTSTTSASDL